MYDATKNWINKLEKHIGRKVKFDTKLTNTWGQWVYGIPQTIKQYDKLPDTICFSKQITKSNNYTCTKVNNSNKSTRNVLPFTNKAVAKVLNKNELYDKTYTIQLYWINGRTAKIKDGFRYKYGLSWCINLIGQYFKLTKKYHVNYTKEDLFYSLEKLCNLYFVNGTKCNCYKQLTSFLEHLYNEYKDKDYSYIESQMKGKIHLYRTEEARRDNILSIRKTLKFDPITNNFIETDRKTLLQTLKEHNISEMTFRNNIHKLGFGIVYENPISPKKTYKNKGKSKYNFNNFKRNNKGQYLIPKNIITPYLRKLACLNKFKIKGILLPD